MSNPTFKAKVNDYLTANTFAGHKTKTLAHNTLIIPCYFGLTDQPTDYRITYHSNSIAQFGRLAHELNASIAPDHPLFGETYYHILSTAGWNSATTVTRLHKLIPEAAKGFIHIGITDGQTMVRAGGFEYPMARALFDNNGRCIVETPNGKFLLAFEGLEK